MKFTVLSVLLILIQHTIIGQTIKRIDGTNLQADSLTNKIERLMQAANVSGVSISVYNENEPVYSKTFGLADVQRKVSLEQNSEMYACSFAKTVFAYIAMQFIQEKIIDPDKPLVEYLTKDLTDYKIDGWNRGYQDLKGDDRYKRITARMCLTHTTGFPNWRWFESDRKLKFKFDPGTRYSYSGEGLYLLQFVLEQLTGIDYETICQERVFKPLKMIGTSMVWQKQFENNLCYGHNEKGEPYELMKWKEASCGGSMTTTPEDFTKFFTAFIKHKNLSNESFEMMTNAQVRIKSGSQFGPLAIVDGTDNDNIKLSYGLGVGVFYTPYGRAFFKEGHDDGWGHYSVAYPDKGVAIVIMTNNDNGEKIFKELLEYAIGDIFTPWKWENYIPYNQKH